VQALSGVPSDAISGPLPQIDESELSNDALLARLPLPEDPGESISNLFRRLDAGLSGCEWPLAETDAEAPADATTTAKKPDSADDELRSALDDLQRIAGRGA
jgi:hypothetical protein